MTRIESTTVTDVRIDSRRLSGTTGRPTARAYSSSFATAKRRLRSTVVAPTATSARAPNCHSWSLAVVRIEPKRYWLIDV